MTGPALGQLLALASAVFFAGATVCMAETRASKGDRGVMFSVVVTILLSALLWLVLEGADLAALNAPRAWEGLAWFALAGLFAMVFGRSLVFVATRRLGVTRASATKRLNPFFSVALAAIVLAEPITALSALGMALIALAFGGLVRDSLRRAPTGPQPPALDYAWGAGAALAYAAAYVTRKLGLEVLPAPALGTLVSALTGLAVFALWALVDARHRDHLTGMFRYLDRWSAGAAVLMSFGQIALFAALLYESVQVIVMIASLDIFVSIFLAVVVMRSERWPDGRTWAAALVATLGVVLVALG